MRVLDDENRAVGPWNPKLDAETLRRMLRMMALTRAFDDRMYRGQRQGKTSFYMKCTGEEATSVAPAMALAHDDMVFPSYRQQGILITRGYPLVEMINQIYSNRADKLKGRQLPIMYSAPEHAFSRSPATSPRNTRRRWAGPWPARSRATPASRRPGSAKDRRPRAISIPR
jgi:2-oxoisovalerate dehydrogenase E1 component alpha subunit